MSIIRNKIIIWGTDDFNTLGILRQFGQHNLDVLFLIKGKAGISTKSKFCRNFIETSTIVDGYNYLIHQFSNELLKPIIITSGDDIITFIDVHSDVLKNFFILPGSKQQGLIERYIDKNNMTALANEVGIKCPQSKFIKYDSSIDNIIYPCIIKPSHEKVGRYNEFKVRKCTNREDLRKILKLVNKESEFIVQQYIPKEKEVLLYGGRMADGNTIIAGAFIKDRLLKSGPGSHGIVTDKIPKSINLHMISLFLEKIDYIGPFSFEYGIIGNNAYFFEVNLRNDGTSHYFYQAGAIILLAYVYSCVGLDYSKISTKVVGDNRFIDEVYDIENIITFRVSYAKWKLDRKEATIFRFYSKDDDMPYRYLRKFRLINILISIFLTRFRIYIVRIGEKFGLKKI